MSAKGFIELLKLNDRGLTRTRDRTQGAKQIWSGVAFRAGNMSLIAPLGEVSEVVSSLETDNIPMVKPWMKGVANLRGRILPLVNLAEFVGVDNKKEKKNHNKKVIVIDQPELFSGLIVDQVFGIQHFESSMYVGETLNVNEGINDYLQGYFKKDNDTVWHVFMLSKLIADEKYLDVAI